ADAGRGLRPAGEVEPAEVGLRLRRLDAEVLQTRLDRDPSNDVALDARRNGVQVLQRLDRARLRREVAGEGRADLVGRAHDRLRAGEPVTDAQAAQAVDLRE